MIAIIIILTVLLGITAYLAYITYVKYKRAVQYAEAYVRFISALYFKFLEVQKTMHDIDVNGSFESDDEVGHTFNALKDCTDDLYKFISRYVNAGEKEKKTEDK